MRPQPRASVFLELRRSSGTDLLRSRSPRSQSARSCRWDRRAATRRARTQSDWIRISGSGLLSACRSLRCLSFQTVHFTIEAQVAQRIAVNDIFDEASYTVPVVGLTHDPKV